MRYGITSKTYLGSVRQISHFMFPAIFENNADPKVRTLGRNDACYLACLKAKLLALASAGAYFILRFFGLAVHK